MKNFGITVIVVILVGVSAFFGGMKYQETKSPVATEGQPVLQKMNGKGERIFMGTGGTEQGKMMTKGGPTNGKVISVDESSITLELPDGSSKIINLSEETQFTKNASASSTDVKEGEQIVVLGETNSDGSISAKSVQLGSALRMLNDSQKGGVEKTN